MKPGVISHIASSLTVVRPLLLCCDPAAERGDVGIQMRRAAMVVAVVWVRQTIWRLFAVRLAQQGVEAVVKVSTEAQVSGVVGAVQRAAVVLSRHREQVLVLVVVGWRMQAVLLEGSE